jgi:hypothetical protein
MTVVQLPEYPVYVISKGRHDVCYTADALIKDQVPFKLVVEPQEAELYAGVYGEDRLLILPFSNLGLGGIPARNWVWEHAKAAGHERHWILDDNIRDAYRLYRGKLIRVRFGVAFKVVEDFTDRYKNIAIAGMNYQTFVSRERAIKPYFLNVHVYSCLLIKNDLDIRWRGKYNEDTDLCLQALANNWCTVLFNVFSIGKMNTMKLKGGNSAELYKGDGRLKMAKSLERQWPYIVSTKRRFDRPQHVVANNWQKFDTPLERREDIDWDNLKPNNYGMKLEQVADEVKSAELNQLISDLSK